jgi:hypothetical protein
MWRRSDANQSSLDDRLIIEAQNLGHHKSKKEAVTEALSEYIQKRKQKEILELFGKIEYDPDDDYKKSRG